MNRVRLAVFLIVCGRPLFQRRIEDKMTRTPYANRRMRLVKITSDEYRQAAIIVAGARMGANVKAKTLTLARSVVELSCPIVPSRAEEIRLTAQGVIVWADNKGLCEQLLAWVRSTLEELGADDAIHTSKKISGRRNA